MPSIQCIDTAKHYGPIQALAPVSLRVESGEFLALLGPSGAGKTTLLRVMPGLEKPDTGVVWIGDQVVAGKGVFVPPQKRRIGMVFQDLALWPHMTVRKHLDFVLKGTGVARAARRKRIGEMLELIRLEDRAAALPHELSGGQQQRVAIARALVVEPKILLLDEPLASLDETLQHRMIDELARLKQWFKITTLYVTHNQREIADLADRVFRIEDLAKAGDTSDAMDIGDSHAESANKERA
ncbi:MAG: ABC transporter ATP-binding protein [Candidatus Hydrogenedentes bacterium]|nr:ABC transporter ATP-binding protein [Candidatus Hydrogenedentota bacterium]